MKFSFVKSRKAEVGKFIPARFEEKKSLKDIQDFRTKRMIEGLVEKQVPFFPPTMSPADKMGDELESVEWALNYYKGLGHDKVCLQTKMMGSRCVVVLRKGEEPFAVSKNGWIINHLDLESQLNELDQRFCNRKESLYDEMILDCELMPWSAMGKGLIERSFYGYSDLWAKEIEICKQIGFEETILKLEDLPKEEYDTLSKKEYIEKHGHHNYRTIREYKKLSKNMIGLDDQQKYLDAFNASLSNYDQEYPAEIKPFQILRTKSSDNDLLTAACYASNAAHGLFYNGDGCRVVNLDDPLMVNVALQFIESLDPNKTEGIVVKPIIARRGEAPYLKVRNKEYLRIVYGPDYTHPDKLEQLMRKKYIRNKLNQSIRQWNMCYDMLTESTEIENALCSYFAKPEPDTDPRL